ncbi:MAG: aminoacetone oxidase family FAD-binding enzyme [Candidatus Paceibacterota bacterium]
MSTRQQYDVIVIGGGASGMMSAGRAAERGRKVLLIEKNKDLGKKLSITGGGRCNILNAEKEERKLLEYYGDASKFLHSPFSQHGMQDSWDFFERNGLPLVVEARKRAFPQSQKAEDVTRTMRQFVIKNNVELNTGTKVRSFIREKGVIVGVETSDGARFAKNFILATGGSSHQDTGSTGEGIEWLKKMGHTVHQPSPNIVPLVAEEDWVKGLSGTSLSFMKITFGADLTKAEGRFSRLGKILFTHFGVSGPLILNAAHEVERLLKGGAVHTTIDMYPDTEISALQSRVLDIFDTSKNKTLKNIIKEFVPVGMSEGLSAQLSDEFLNTKVHSIGKEERRALVQRLKAMPLTITATKGLDWAVTSDGGVDLTEVDTKTMRSKMHKNLFFTGDVLHINRPSGGYSLQLCWTTGHVAGSSV